MANTQYEKKTTCVLLVHLNYVNTLCKYFILLKFAEFLFLKKVQMLYKTICILNGIVMYFSELKMNAKEHICHSHVISYLLSHIMYA